MSKLREEFRTLDFIFRHESEIFHSVEKIKNAEVSIFNDSHLRDPTAADALKNLIFVESVTVSGKKIISPQKWLKIISATYSAAKIKNFDVYEIARRRYNNEDYRKTCIDLNISNTTRRRLLELVQIYAALQAVQFGLIKI